MARAIPSAIPCANLARAMCPRPVKHNYLFAVPRASFFTLRFFEPRAYSRLASGFSALRFLRAARLDFLRSSLLRAAVLAISPRVLRLNLFQLRVLLYQLLQAEARELYRNLGIFTVSFTLVDGPFAILWVTYLLPRSETFFTFGFFHWHFGETELFPSG